MMNPYSKHSGILVYTTAILITVLTLGICELLMTIFRENLPLLMFIIPVVISARYGGFKSGLLATILSGILGVYFLIAPLNDLTHLPLTELLRIGIFLLEGILISGLFEAWQNSPDRTDLMAQSLQESEECYRVLVEGVEDYAIYLLDPSGRVSSWNLGAERVKGYPAIEVLGHHYSMFFTETDQENHIPEKILQTAAEKGHYKGEGWRKHKNGSLAWTSIAITALYDSQGQLKGFTNMIHDISHRKQAEDEKNQLLKDLSDVKYALDQAAILAITDNKGVITGVNDKFCQLSGYSEPELIGKTHKLINSGYHSPAFFQQMWKTIATGEVWHGEICNRSKQGQLYWVDTTIVPFLDENQRPFQYLSIRFDITSRKQAEDKLVYDVLHDGLTQLPNRVLLTQRVEQALEKTKRQEDYRFAVLFIDLDHFKEINDTLGHDIGDLLLISVAEKLLKCVRAVDTVARLGGDEFIIFLDDLQDQEEACQIADRILNSLTLPISLDKQEVSVTASIGIAFNSNQKLSVTEILRNADLAMYKAKERGKSCYALYNSQNASQAQAQSHQETLIQIALEHHRSIIPSS